MAAFWSVVRVRGLALGAAVSAAGRNVRRTAYRAGNHLESGDPRLADRSVGDRGMSPGGCMGMTDDAKNLHFKLSIPVLGVS